MLQTVSLWNRSDIHAYIHVTIVQVDTPINYYRTTYFGINVLEISIKLHCYEITAQFISKSQQITSNLHCTSDCVQIFCKHDNLKLIASIYKFLIKNFTFYKTCFFHKHTHAPRWFTVVDISCFVVEKNEFFHYSCEFLKHFSCESSGK